MSPTEPGGKTESRIQKTSRVGEEQVSTLGPGGQVKPGIQGLGKGEELLNQVETSEWGAEAVYFLLFGFLP